MFEAKGITELCRELGCDIKGGLTPEEAGRRQQEYGKNELKEPEKSTKIELFFEQLQDPLIYVLLAAAAVSILLGEISDAIIIIVVVLLNGVVGMIQEGKAQRALDALKKLTSPSAYVVRAGKKREIPAAELVAGDLVCLEAGCQVPADLRLVETAQLKVEESALTGESLSVQKDAGFLAKKQLPLGDRKNMAYMSAMVTGGRGMGIVVATGMKTEIGKIASLINESKGELTPLQKKLGELGKFLSFLSVILCVLLFILAVLQHRDMGTMFLTAISLAVAAVPEGLPAVVTICLALSVTKMVKVHTIIRRLPSVETLGAVSVVCSDKTGTLTQNKMTVVKCYVNGKIYEKGHPDLREQKEFLEGMVLCNDASRAGQGRMGDATELALLDFGAEKGVEKESLELLFPRKKEISFDSSRKMMSTFHQKGGETVTYTKGAPDVILKRSNRILVAGTVKELDERERNRIHEAIRELSSQALRTLAIALRRQDSAPQENDLIFVGMAAMEDPVRPEAVQAVGQFKLAGITTVMITGDHVDTALAIARQLGIASGIGQCMTGEELGRLSEKEVQHKIEEIKVFARVSPEHKVQIVKALKQKGHIVAMTGDGVNDAPSLKGADIGIAMGLSGTDVAKQASDMILTDDNFATIEKAIEEGRGVYENIKKSVVFLLSSNLGEIMTMFCAILCGFLSPLKSSHILWINLITDSLPALALGADKNNGASLMKRKPRKAAEGLFANGGLAITIFYGVLIAGISLLAFLLLPYGILIHEQQTVTIRAISQLLQNPDIYTRAQTYAFTVLGMSQLFHAVGMRDVRTSIFKMNHWNNKLMITACVLGFLLQFAVTEIPYLTGVFGTVALSVEEWIQLTILAAFPLLAHEIMTLLLHIKPSH